MTHTPDVMAHLETFREGASGRQQLFTVLAAAGIPVHQVLSVIACSVLEEVHHQRI
jgi:hypothetical protein